MRQVKVKFAIVGNPLFSEEVDMIETSAYLALKDKVSELESELLRKAKELESAREVISYYADQEPQVSMEFAHPDDKEKNDPEIGTFVRPDDFEYIFDKIWIGSFHGKRAREWMKLEKK